MYLLNNEVMNTRQANQNDLRGILTLFEDTVAEVNKHDYSASQLEAWKSSSRDRERWLNKISSQYFLVTEENHVITGFASITPEGYLDTMFVHKNHQRKGIAGRLVKALILFAREQDISEIITDASITARPFFEKLGFEVVKKQTVNRKGIAITNFKMKKLL